ncbi:fructosamine kinase family protein [Sulfuriroseicoccus oceanibius]|uniref:Fructosamine kinase family protein n=1 Tax=Sulfuriroseicoccus oceanibius TaxID=2707525 RepID=A0A6B3L6E4_9BACT|nr:fructosamine kinase family protein [Sulfuriroseicoccus oceanibius]QQL45177.1 fructosamine kinase family protein [Sulfuriroseicoccus oceanibius]
MNPDPIRQSIADAGYDPPDGDWHQVGGGCISSAMHWQNYFVKYGPSSQAAMMEAERESLQHLWRAQCIRVPRPLASGSTPDMAWLVMEWLPLGGAPDPRRLGRELTQLHQTTSAWSPRFGWHGDNFIGTTPQSNARTTDWCAFFIGQRLRPMLDACHDLGIHLHHTEALVDACATVLDRHSPEPSLVHGDLWTGNAGFLASDSAPVLFDPASYFGDREVDLAMSELFGGFGPAFFKGVDEEWPLPPGYPQRRTIYNLYHILNHAILFGGGYPTQAQSMIDDILRG